MSGVTPRMQELPLARRCQHSSGSRAHARTSATVLGVLACLFVSPIAANADLPAANSDVRPAAADARLAKMLRDADAAEAIGEYKLALIHLKQAVLLYPLNGDLHARVGTLLLRTGAVVPAERELRQARTYKAPDALVVPSLLQVMLTRREFQQVLDEFRDPQANQDSLAPFVLRARAVALQALGHPAEADDAMDRALKLLRDAHGLITRAQLAAQQNDPGLGLRLANEAFKLAPNDEDTLSILVLLLRQQDSKAALGILDDFVARAPKSVVGRSLRADTLLALNEVAKAKQDADWLVSQYPDQPEGRYYQSLITARTKDAKTGWREAASLPPEYLQSDPSIALTVAQLASAAGATESATSILASLVQRHPDIAEARVELAVLRLSQNNPDLALQSLQPLTGSDNPRVQAMIAQADMRLGHYSDAITALKKATSFGPIARGDILKRQLAQSELLLGSTDKAVQELRQLLAQDPKNTDAAVQLANIFSGLGKPAQALAEIDRVAKLQPKNALMVFYRGQILSGDGQLAAASDAYSQAIAIDPKFLPAFYTRAGIAVARGRPGDALKDLQTVIAHDPGNIPAYLLRATIALDAGRDAEFVGVLQSAMKAAPKDPAPGLALARFQMESGKFQDAQASLGVVLRISPDNAQAMAMQGDILFATGEKAKAVEKFRALVIKYPNLPDVQLAWSRALDRVNDPVRAEAAAEKAVELAPTDAQYRSDLIALQLAHGKPVDALLTARAYRDLHPGQDADLLVSGTLFLLKRESEAEALLEQSFNANPDRTLALGFSGLELKLGKNKKAVDVLARSVAKNPDDFELRRQYGLMLVETGDRAGATREFEGLLKQRPDDTVVLSNLALLIQHEDAARALSLISLAAKVAPRSAAILDVLGWMKYQRHDATGALPLLQRAQTLKPSDPEVSYHYALALEATGRRDAAKNLLKAVLARSPAFTDARDAQRLVASW